MTIEQCCESILGLWSVAKHLRAGRYETGSVSLNNSKLAFRLDGHGNPVETWNYVTKEANNLVSLLLTIRLKSSCF